MSHNMSGILKFLRRQEREDYKMESGSISPTTAFPWGWSYKLSQFYVIQQSDLETLASAQGKLSQSMGYYINILTCSSSP